MTRLAVPGGGLLQDISGDVFAPSHVKRGGIGSALENAELLTRKVSRGSVAEDSAIAR